MFMELLSRLLEFFAIVWLVRFLLKNLIGGGSGGQKFRQSQSRGPFRSPFSSSFGSPFGSNDQPPSPSAPPVVTGEMKKDPQCGTYVSTELSLKYKYGNEVLHFCSRQCQEDFLRAHAGKPA